MSDDELSHLEARRAAAELLGRQLRAIRQSRDVSQEAIALSAGISVHAYGCLERGKTPAGSAANPTLDTLLRVFDALGVEPPSLERLPASGMRDR